MTPPFQISLPSGWAIFACFLLAAIATGALCYCLRLLGRLEKAQNPRKTAEFNETKAQQLLADLSHDLRTPVTAIQGYLETLLTLDDKLSPEERRDYIGSALRNTKSISKQVQDMLTALAHSGQPPPAKKRAIPVAELFEAAEMTFTQRARQKAIAFSVELDNQQSGVMADPSMIERVLSNLLANAFRYTPDGGNVSLSCRTSRTKVLIEVKDNGTGIPKQDLPHIVERFYRVNKDRSRSTGGSGLGLAIAQDFLRSHGTELAIASDVGRGTCVSFELQRA